MNITHIKNFLLKSSTYLLNDYLVDCGDSQQIFEALAQNELKGIFLTHCHQDHVYGIEKVLTRYPNTKIYCSEKTLKGLIDPHLNLSYIMPEFSFTFSQTENVVILTEGIHMIGNLELEIISTTGHSDDCMTYIVGNNIFTGDAYIPFAKVFTKWPTSNKKEAIENEQKLLNIINERKLNVFPGHWE